jgi:alpha-amylase
MHEITDMHRNLQSSCKDPTLLLTFASNHDTTRLAGHSSSLALRKNAITYTMLSDGIPTLYQGDEQGFSGISDPENREAMWLSGFDKNAPLYTMIRTLNKLRAWAGRNDSDYWTSTTSIRWSGPHSLAMQKGPIMTVLTNRGDATAAETETVYLMNSEFAAGTILMDVIACEKLEVGHDGVFFVELTGGNPKVFYPLDQLTLSGICDPWLFKTETLRLPKLFLR